jgi:hypothetical protein
MKVYTCSEARQNLAILLEQARRKGAVHIRRRDGQSFVLKPEARIGSPLDIDGVDLDLTADEIVAFVRGRPPPVHARSRLTVAVQHVPCCCGEKPKGARSWTTEEASTSRSASLRRRTARG